MAKDEQWACSTLEAGKNKPIMFIMKMREINFGVENNIKVWRSWSTFALGVCTTPTGQILNFRSLHTASRGFKFII